MHANALFGVTKSKNDVHMVQRLCGGHWFTTRVSACGLIATAYQRGSTACRTELRQLFCDLGRDETPMVRRAIFQRLGDYAKAVEPEYLSTEVIPTFLELTQDGEQYFTHLLSLRSPLNERFTIPLGTAIKRLITWPFMRSRLWM